MRYVKLTDKQSKEISSYKIGITSGKRNKDTGLRPIVKFCSSLDFTSVFGYDIEREFIQI